MPVYIVLLLSRSEVSDHALCFYCTQTDPRTMNAEKREPRFFVQPFDSFSASSSEGGFVNESRVSRHAALWQNTGLVQGTCQDVEDTIQSRRTRRLVLIRQDNSRPAPVQDLHDLQCCDFPASPPGRRWAKSRIHYGTMVDTTEKLVGTRNTENTLPPHKDAPPPRERPIGFPWSLCGSSSSCRMSHRRRSPTDSPPRRHRLPGLHIARTHNMSNRLNYETGHIKEMELASQPTSQPDRDR